ncbi:DNA polymerase I [Hydromonas duriensis]|uniref:DNA polymerase I n=1 Tax=Hydromonas duriensis TaxID=1527608 RepID=A0A4R6YBA4_9BURK|nr:DNA polymerase I [Hydromonas duriensis]TDR32805.1 DNA polymerase I [Hydromonas duriensis]
MSLLSDFLAQTDTEHTLLLVDGSSFLYRAYHGLPDLRSPSGAPTGALYGIINMLKRLRTMVPTAHALCVFDAKGKTFRDEWYPEYKANRPSMPDDLALQIPVIEAAVRALGWPVLSMEGVEADDVIGTLSVQAAGQGWVTVMATGDKDLTQLVNERVLWFNTMSDEVLDANGVTAKFGVPPQRIVDYLTLVGDTVDNVPGVEKVGPKTAVKWLTEYDSLDNLITHADKVTGKVGENLRSTLDWLPMARRLVTVKCDLQLTSEASDLGAFHIKNEDRTALRQIYEQAGFKSWLKTLLATEGEAPALAFGESGSLFDAVNTQATTTSSAASNPIQETEPVAITAFKVNYTIVNTHAALSQMYTALTRASLVAFDSETTSLSPFAARIVGLSFATDAQSGWYIPLMHEGMQTVEQLPIHIVLRTLKTWFEDENAKKIGQNLKYDAHVLANHGIALRGIAHDTLLQSYVLDSHAKHALDAIAERYLRVSSVSYEDLCGKGAAQIPFAQVDIERAAQYAVEDAALCLGVHAVMYPRICADDGLKKVYEQIELPTSDVLFTMERAGVMLDVEALRQQSHHLGQQLLSLETQAHELAGQPFNLNSPKQIGEIFFEKLGMPVVKKTAKGAPSTDEDVLQKLAEDYPLPKAMLEYRSLSKLKSTYTDKLPLMVEPSTGRVHTHYAQTVAVTGRLSSNEPNLQNIPVRTEQGRKVRTAFVAPAGSVMMSADYSQIELRILAHLSQDPGLLSAFANNEDVHQRTAAQIFGVALGDVSFEQRRMAKMINFGLIYGMSAFGLAGNLDISRTAAQQYMDQYFMQYPTVLQFMESTKQFAREHGYVLTHFGRRLYLPDINDRNQGKRQGAERAAINAPMQGTSADLIKLAMIKVQQVLVERQLQSKLIMQVHDELVLEVPDNEVTVLTQLIPECMAGVAQLDVPLVAEVGVGLNWELAH